MFAPGRLILTLLWLFSLAFSAAVVVAEENAATGLHKAAEGKAPDFVTVLPASKAVKGVVLMVHGLNNNPSRFLPLAKKLNSRQQVVVLVKLEGHDMSVKNASWRLSRFRKVTPEIWARQFSESYAYARQIANHHNAPLFAITYSLGGLLTVNGMLSSDEITFNKVVLLAPAISLRWYSTLLWPLTFFPSLTLPGFSPDEYRANSGTPMAAYNALFSLRDQVHARVNSKLTPGINQASLILMTETDELVSYSGIQDWIQQNRLDRWSIVAVTKSPDNQTSFDHLMVDEAAMGKQGWQRLWREISVFLFNTGS